MSDVWRNAFNDLDENGDVKPQPRKIKSDSRVNRGRANRLKAQNPEFQENRLKKLEEVRNTDTYKQIDKKAREKRWSNPDEIKKQSQLMTEQNFDPKKKQKRVSAMKKAWQDPNLQKSQSEKSKEIWSKPENKAKRQAHGLKCSKPIMTPKGEFQTVGKAAEYFCLEWGLKQSGSVSRIKKYIELKKANWFYIKK